MSTKITFGPCKVASIGIRGAVIYIPKSLIQKLKGKTVIVTVEIIDTS